MTDIPQSLHKQRFVIQLHARFPTFAEEMPSSGFCFPVEHRTPDISDYCNCKKRGFLAFNMIQIAHQLEVTENGSRKPEIQATTSDTLNSIEFRTNAVGRRWTRSSRDLVQSIQLFQLPNYVKHVGFVQLLSSKRLWSIAKACKIEVDYLQNMSLEGLEGLEG